jgi:hypothetical protein
MREHGTYARYKWGAEGGGSGNGCRCEPCRKAAADYERERRHRTAPSYVSATPVRNHIESLRSQGMGVKSIARAAGMSASALGTIVYGKGNGKPPSRRVMPETASKILAVTIADSAEGGRIPAGPSLAVVDELLRRGWSKVAIAEGIGQSRALQIGTEFIEARHARALRALLDQPVVGRGHRNAERPVTELPAEDDQPAQHHDFDDLLLEFVEVLEDRIDGRHWRAKAACRFESTPTWMFFPSRGDDRLLAAARSVCASCPVATQCAEYVSRRARQPGIWGGLSEKQRRPVRAA